MSNYLLVVGNDGVLVNQDTFIRDRLQGQGHTVTIIDDGAAAPADIDTTYHAVIMSSTANINQITTKYDTTTRGVLSFFAYPHSKFTNQPSPSNGTVTTTQYSNVANGDAIIPTGSGTNITYLSTAALHTYVDSSTLGAGSTNFLFARNDLVTRITGARYVAGAIMSDGTTAAPSRRVRMGFTDLTFLNATGLIWFDNAVTWVTTALANNSPTANAGPDQDVAANTLVTLTGLASSDTDGTITGYAWSQISGTAVTLSNAAVAQPTFTSPASLTGATLVFGLIVTDNLGATSTQDTVTITVAKRAQLKVRISGSWVIKPLKTRVSGSWQA